jgi:hypothetical protein
VLNGLNKTPVCAGALCGRVRWFGFRAALIQSSAATKVPFIRNESSRRRFKKRRPAVPTAPCLPDAMQGRARLRDRGLAFAPVSGFDTQCAATQTCCAATLLPYALAHGLQGPLA